MSNVVDFRSRKSGPPDRARGEYVFTVHIYEEPNGNVDLFAEQADADEVDVERLIDDMSKGLWAAEANRFDETDDLDHDLLLAVRVYRSSLVSSRWLTDVPDVDDAFETPAQLRWLWGRLEDAYWQVDERRGLGWFFWRMKRNIARIFQGIKG